MKGKLIKTAAQYILCVDEQEVQKFEAALDTMYGWVVADEHGSDIAKLSPENCQAIVLGYDLHALAEESAKGLLEPMMRATAIIHFKAGFFKALELLGSREFTEFNMRTCFYDDKYDVPMDFDEYIKRYRKTEWEVEVVMEPALKDCGEGETNYFVPATDKNGCLILKPL